jgi:hypothetical protein
MADTNDPEVQVAIDRLIEIREEMAELLGEAGEVLQRTDSELTDAAEAYWFIDIRKALGIGRPYVGISMADTIRELANGYGDDTLVID